MPRDDQLEAKDQVTVSQRDALILRNDVLLHKLIKAIAFRTGLSPEQYDELFGKAQIATEAELLNLRALDGDFSVEGME